MPTSVASQPLKKKSESLNQRSTSFDTIASKQHIGLMIRSIARIVAESQNRASMALDVFLGEGEMGEEIATYKGGSEAARMLCN